MRLLIEEFGITIKYIKGINNTVADALSRLEFTPKKSDTSETIDYSGRYRFISVKYG